MNGNRSTFRLLILIILDPILWPKRPHDRRIQPAHRFAAVLLTKHTSCFGRAFLSRKSRSDARLARLPSKATLNSASWMAVTSPLKTTYRQAIENLLTPQLLSMGRRC